MESPKRKAQKSRDYRRHRMMRLLNRRKATAQQAMSKIAEKELMRRLRITPLKKFEDGKDAEYDAGILDDVVITGNRRPANIMFDKDTGNYYRESTGDVVTPVNKLVEDDPSTWSFADKNGTTFTPHGPVFNLKQGEIRQVEETPFLSNNYIKQAAHNYMSELAYDINNNRVVGGKYTMPAIALAPVIGSKIGGAAINSAFASHGLNHAVNEGVNGIGDAVLTGLEMAPLGPLVKPLYTGLVKPLYTGVVRPGMQFLNSPITRKAPQITAENAASMTPEQWTAAQDAAIARGDMEEAQRLRDLHFKVSAPNTKVVDINGNPQLVIHKTPSDFTIFDNSKSIGRLNWVATPEAFGENKVFATGAGTNPKEMRLYINMKNPHYPTIDEGMEPAYINEGEDGILGIVDKDWTGLYKSASDAGEGFNMSLGVDNPYALKSADAVTFDDNGVRISLGERDNFKLNDIRYGLLPFGIGLTGLGVSTGTPLKKFEDGKNALLSSTPKLSNMPKFNFDAPVIEKVVPKYEEIKPAIETPVEPVKQREPIIPGLQPQQSISDSRFSRSHPIFKDEYDYMNSDAFLTRVKKMTNDNEKARILATNMRNNLYHTNLPNKAFYDYTSYSQNSGFRLSESGPYMHKIYYGRVNDVPGFTKRSVIAHELGHSVYDTNKDGSLLDYHLLSPQYTSVLQRGRYKTLVDDDTRRHDYQDGERIADIRALQQQAKDAGIWDKTTGVDMTPEMYNKLKQTYPDHRSFDMWNDEDLRWLINTTAQIKPVKNNIYYT